MPLRQDLLGFDAAERPLSCEGRLAVAWMPLPEVVLNKSWLDKKSDGVAEGRVAAGRVAAGRVAAGPPGREQRDTR